MTTPIRRLRSLRQIRLYASTYQRRAGKSVLAPMGFLLAVASSVLIARWLGPHTFADYATLLAVLWLLTLLAESGCNVGLQRYLAEAGGRACARRRFYGALQLRRWCVVGIDRRGDGARPGLGGASAVAPALWGPVTFGLIAFLAGLTLHSQLAASEPARDVPSRPGDDCCEQHVRLSRSGIGLCLYLRHGAYRAGCCFACSRAYRSVHSSLVCRSGVWAGTIAVAAGFGECGAAPRPGCDCRLNARRL